MVEEVAQTNVMAHNGGNAEQAARWGCVQCRQATQHACPPPKLLLVCRGTTWCERQLLEETHSLW
jgi:hypothetical protein